jgi:YbgC/YbaW family acyl-CoA thioester hydrolase
MPSRFVIKRRVQFAETDLAGVLHFSNYFRIMEEVEHAFWRSLDLSVVMPDGESHISWPRVACSCEYFGPARFEDELDVGLTLENVGNRSIAFEVEFRRGADRLALAKCTAVCCAMRDGAFTAIAIPGAVRRQLEAASHTDSNTPS